MYKRVFSLLICVLFVFGTCGCYIGSGAGMRRREHKKAKVLFGYLQDEDIESIEELFADNASRAADLDRQLDDFFDEIDGDIESYGRIDVSIVEEWVDDWKTTRAMLQVTFRDVTTDEGVTYDEIVYMSYAVHQDPDLVGINVMSLITDDKEVISVGGYTE